MYNTTRSFFVVAGITLFSYGLSFINQLMYSRYFGTSASLDAVYIAQTCITMLSFYIGPFKDVCLPHAYHLHGSDPEAGNRYFSAIMNFVLLLLIFSFSLAFFFPDFNAHLVLNRNDGQIYNKTTCYIRILSPLIIISNVAGMLGFSLASYNKIIFQNLGRFVGVSVSIIILFLFAERLKVRAILLSMIATEGILFLIQAVEFFKIPLKYRPWTLPKVEFASLKKILGMLSVFIFSQVYIIYERRVFSQFGPGIISAYQYGKNLFAIPESILITTAVSALWPRMLENSKKASPESLSVLVLRSCCIMTTVLTVIASILFFNAREIIYFLYFRGAFDQVSLQNTTIALKCLSFALVPYALSMIIGRIFYSLMKIRFAMVVGVVTTFSGLLTLFLADLLNNKTLSYCHYLGMATGSAAICVVGFVKYTHPVSLSAAMRALFWMIRLTLPVLAAGYAISKIDFHTTDKLITALSLVLKGGLTVIVSVVFLYCVRIINNDHIKTALSTARSIYKKP